MTLIEEKVVPFREEKPTEKPTLPTTSKMETVLLRLEDIDSWVTPRFQRPIKHNPKVEEFKEGLKANGGIIDGVITLGRLPGDPKIYLVDGQQRCQAARLSGLVEFIADTRIIEYENMRKMAIAFLHLNSHLVALRADDLLRAAEEDVPELRELREKCPFVGYENIRRYSTNSCLLSMSAALRAWKSSRQETPAASGIGAVLDLPDVLLESKELDHLVEFLTIAHSAWGTDPENYRLWTALNLTMCMYLFRHLVLAPPERRRNYTLLTAPQFQKCLMSVSAAADYAEWLVSRHLSERDRPPCYNRLRALFVGRLADQLGKKPKMPQPAWLVGPATRGRRA